MAELILHSDELVVELSTKEKLGALHGDISIPFSSVVDIRRESAVRTRARGLRAPGTGVPGLISLGTWRSRGMRAFVAAYRNDAGYVIDLNGHKFDRIIVSSPLVPGIADILNG